VYQAMMMPAELDQVIKTGFTTIGPVLYVVAINERGVGAAGEAATAVPETQGPADGRRYGPGFTAYGQDFTVLIFCQLENGTIAGQSTGCFRGNMGAVLYTGGGRGIL
jgi:hypothetical protein